MRAAIVGIAGPELTLAEVSMLRAARPAGVILFARNIVAPAQLAALMATLRRVLPPHAVLMVDQEGGRVARLRPPHWRAHPPAAAIGALFDADPARAVRAAFLTGAVIGAEAFGAGFSVVCAPVLDIHVPGSDAVIGDRAFHADPVVAARLGHAMAAGLLAAGIIPVGKHAPGHGRAMVDSHHDLPTLDAPSPADLLPFQRHADLPWMMTAHIRYTASDGSRPATLSASVIERVIRTRIGFSGVLVSDDLAMGALAACAATPAERARLALAAGCDLAMHCGGELDDTGAVLAACGDVSAVTAARMACARGVARSRRRPIDVAAWARERDRLIP